MTGTTTESLHSAKETALAFAIEQNEQGVDASHVVADAKLFEAYLEGTDPGSDPVTEVTEAPESDAAPAAPAEPVMDDAPPAASEAPEATEADAAPAQDSGGDTGASAAVAAE
jgi:hypothetical protein